MKKPKPIRIAMVKEIRSCSGVFRLSVIGVEIDWMTGEGKSELQKKADLINLAATTAAAKAYAGKGGK